MNVSIIGKQIYKFRKDCGLTQEELGQKVGVSTQAVSRWECGGTPDIALLPTIADVLRVNVDALFGRDGSADTGEDRYKKYIASLSNKQCLNGLIKFVYDAVLLRESYDLANVVNDFPSHAKAKDVGYNYSDVLCLLEEGFMFGVCANDFSFMSVFPEPDEGYAHYLADNDSYRRLFSALAQPNALEVLVDVASEECSFIMPAAAAKQNNISEEAAKQALEALSEVHIIDKVAVKQGHGTEYAYSFRMDRPIVPLLLFAAIVGQESLAHFTVTNHRTSAIFKRPASEE